MKYLKNNIGVCHYSQEVTVPIEKFFQLAKQNPYILEPFHDMNEKIKEALSGAGFQLYPTVKTTTLFFDPTTECFFKFLHPLTIKNRLLFFLKDKAQSIYNLSEYLHAQGILLPHLVAYGKLKKSDNPFISFKKIDGQSLYSILVKEKRKLPFETYLKVMDEVIKMHKLGFWFGDAHLSHIFLKNSVITGFIDIDSIRKNRFFTPSNFAKDISGLNHPELPLSKDEKKKLLTYYLDKISRIQEREKFLQMVKYYTERRWQRHTI